MKFSLKFLVLLIASFIFFATTTLSLIKLRIPEQIQVIIAPKKVDLANLPRLPVLTNNGNFPEFSAEGVLAVDLRSGVTLYAKNPDDILLPASTTKIVSALVSLDFYPLDQIVEVGDLKVDGQKMQLKPGEKITVESLLYGLLVYSANDAAEVLAANYPGGRDAFISAMNAKAKELQLEKSTFSNPTGLDASDHVTTARDLVKVSMFAMKNPIFSQIVKTKEIEVSSIDAKIKHKLININELLGGVEGVLGIKTGWTENAKENLVTYIERNGHDVMIVLLGSDDRFGETKKLIDWIFTNYRWQNIPNP